MRQGRGRGGDRPSEGGWWLRSTCQPPPRRARTAAPAHASRNSKTSTARHEAARQCQCRCRCRSLPLLAGAGLDPPRDAAAALAPLPPAAPFSSRRPVVGGGGGGGVQIRASVRGLPSVFAHCCWPVGVDLRAACVCVCIRGLVTSPALKIEVAGLVWVQLNSRVLRQDRH